MGAQMLREGIDVFGIPRPFDHLLVVPDRIEEPHVGERCAVAAAPHQEPTAESGLTGVEVPEVANARLVSARSVYLIDGEGLGCDRDHGEKTTGRFGVGVLSGGRAV